MDDCNINYFKQHKININKIFTSSYSNQIIWQTNNNQLYQNVNDPTLIPNTPPFIIDIANGENHTILLTDHESNQFIPYLVSYWTRSLNIIPDVIITIICNYFVKNTVYSTKYTEPDNYGQNGDGTNNFSHHHDNGYHNITAFEHSTITKIAAGKSHSLFLDKTNTLWVCGRNDDGQLGLGNDRLFGQIPMPNTWFSFYGIQIKNIACGAHHCLILGDNGNCYAFGSNTWGQCGVGHLSDITRTISAPRAIFTRSGLNIVEIKCGYRHSYVKEKQENTIRHYLFGINEFAQCTLKSITRIEYNANDTVITPFCINATFAQLSGFGKDIVDIHLGFDTTWIITENK